METVNLWQVDIWWSGVKGSGIDSILVDLGHDGDNKLGAGYFRTQPPLRAIRAALDQFEGNNICERRIESIKLRQAATMLVKAS